MLQQKRQRDPNTSISSNSPVGTKIFKVIYPEPKKRNHIYKERYKRADLIKIKIVTHFFNVYLIRRSTEEIRKAGSIDNFKIFPKKFIEKVTKKENKKIWEKTLKDIFNNKDSEFYESRFEKNYNIIKKLKSDLNKHIVIKSGLNEKLGLNICDLYKNHLKSNCYENNFFKISIEFDVSYAQKYKKISKNLINNIFGNKKKKI